MIHCKQRLTKGGLTVARLFLISALLFATAPALAGPPPNAATEKGITPSYLKVCGPWSCEEIGTTCRSVRGVCGWSWEYPCLTEFTLYDCERTCHWVDHRTGEVVDTWVEEALRERHSGCCNICVMRRSEAEPRLWIGGWTCTAGDS